MGKHSSLIELILRYVPPDQKSAAKSVTQSDRMSPVIVLVTSGTAPFLPFLPLIGGGAFLVCIMFAFSCALSAMFLYRKPQAAKFFRFSAITCLSSALLLLLHRVFLDGLS